MNCGIIFSLTCKRCRCKMEFSTEKFSPPHEKICCQNCGQDLPEWYTIKLFNAIDAVNRVPQDSDGEMGKGFELDYKTIPSSWDSEYSIDPEEDDQD